MSKQRSLRILWPIDPFETESETRAHVVEALKKISKGRSVSIEPVYVLSPNEFDLNLTFTSPWSNEYKETSQKILFNYLSSVNLPGLLPPKILIERQPSLGRSVRTLLNYAKKSGSQWITVGTHARKGLFRVFLGSFAETLILHSKIPLLIVGPHSNQNKIDTILFATDLSKKTDTLFSKVLELASQLGSKITVFHAMTHPVQPIVQSGVYLLGGGWIQWPEFISTEEEKKRKLADRYIQLGKKKGVQVKVLIDSGPTSTSSLILKNAKKEGVSLIAMAAESGPLSAALIGSTTRQVVRESECPVWVMRSPEN